MRAARQSTCPRGDPVFARDGAPVSCHRAPAHANGVAYPAWEKLADSEYLDDDRKKEIRAAAVDVKKQSAEAEDKGKKALGGLKDKLREAGGAE